MDRRSFLGVALVCLVFPLSARGDASRSAAGARRAPAVELPRATLEALEQSPFVYVSPLRRDGKESACHGEVWFGWLDGAVILTTVRTSWKARSVAQGLGRARLWVGSYGRWKQLLGRNEAFRAGPSFTARVRRVEDAALVERLLALYAQKYPKEFPSWDARMREGHGSGERVLLRYEPESA